MSGYEPCTFGPVDVPLVDVERELTRHLKQAHGVSDAPVHRARMSNLIVFCDTIERAAEVEAIIPDIVAIHPARVLMLVAQDHSGSSDIHSSIMIRKAGHEVQLCSEQVTLRGGTHSSEHLSFAARHLVIGDLPTNLWWATHTPPPIAGPILEELAENAQQVIYDSLGWADPHRGIAATSDWLSRFERGSGQGKWRVVSDLNWRRLKIWRRIIGQAFAPAAAPGAVDSITEVRIDHGPHAVTLAWSLVGWLAYRLEWTIQATRFKPGVEIAFQIQAPHGPLRLTIDRLADGPSEIRRVRVACSIAGRLGALDFVADNAERLSVLPEGIDAAPRTISVNPMDTAEMLARQLSDREPDVTFREAMKSAKILAQAVVGR